VEEGSGGGDRGRLAVLPARQAPQSEGEKDHGGECHAGSDPEVAPLETWGAGDRDERAVRQDARVDRVGRPSAGATVWLSWSACSVVLMSCERPSGTLLDVDPSM
jgi:hypothetical protein